MWAQPSGSFVQVTQEFVAEWPGVLQEIYEYLALSAISLGPGRSGTALLELSKQRVKPSELQPHVAEFQQLVARQLPALKLQVCAEQIPFHRATIGFN